MDPGLSDYNAWYLALLTVGCLVDDAWSFDASWETGFDGLQGWDFQQAGACSMLRIVI